MFKDLSQSNRQSLFMMAINLFIWGLHPNPIGFFLMVVIVALMAVQHKMGF